MPAQVSLRQSLDCKGLSNYVMVIVMVGNYDFIKAALDTLTEEQNLGQREIQGLGSTYLQTFYYLEVNLKDKTIVAKRVSMMTFEINVMYDHITYASNRKHWNNKGRYSAWKKDGKRKAACTRLIWTFLYVLYPCLYVLLHKYIQYMN
jgi:hypothetical protein